MIKKIIGSMEDYKERKAEGRLSLAKGMASVSGDDYVVKMKRYDGETGEEVEPMQFGITTKDLDLRVTEIEDQVTALETEKGRLMVLKDDLIALD